ncbi:septum formation family protein [Arthrobacter sp. zg-Y1219]|uniref:septum formation family protein n=1 Tax=Arthrobacter sp. zg-Y1219 TaxID=3049067 RepID=UPI0024C3A8BC|nr:septum formation family protein [Arthrobacter sp. zg-Y1219]MDK1360009.1 septum formation family protein [Arthrobacter sp. zg-Y1219]
MSDKNSMPGADSSPPAGASKATPASAQAEGTDAHADATVPAGTGLPDLEAHAEAPLWLSGDEDHDGRIWDGAFAAETGSDAVEPTLTNPEDVTLATPSLSNPDISSDAAEAASLEDATAEVKAVEAEAADAAVLTDPAANHPAAANHTAGITAAAPMTGVASDANAKDATAAEAAAKESGPAADAPSPEAPSPAAVGAAEPAESRRSRRNSEPPAASEGNGRSKQILLIIGALGVLAVLVVLLFTLLGNSANEPGVLEEDVAPIELESGACLQDFAGINEPTNVVSCETPHNAQLVATTTYPDSGEFPGTDALSTRATELCSDVRYSETLAERTDLDLQENKAIPTPESWNDGDRRVDCFVVAGGGQELTESLLEP